MAERMSAKFMFLPVFFNSIKYHNLIVLIEIFLADCFFLLQPVLNDVIFFGISSGISLNVSA